MLSIDPQTIWINAVNILLGVVTLCCLAMIASVVINELLERWVARLMEQPGGDRHAFTVRGLGATMADGGEPLSDDEKASGPDFYGF
jgi:hypothetical protein